MTISLDMLLSDQITNHEKCLSKIFSLFNSWLEKNPMIPVIALKANLSHSMQNVFNPLPGLLYITVIYQFKTSLEYIETNMAIKKDQEFDKFLQNLAELVDKVQLLTLKLFKDIANIIQSTKLFGPEVFKLLNVKHLEKIARRFEELSGQLDEVKKTTASKECVENLNSVREDCLERLAQILEACWQYDFTTCKKSECIEVLKAGCFDLRLEEDISDLDADINLLSMILSC